jgi:2',3'-cyclic-nucleotide 2'-phosphodiesterase (5'-nucleotidase family)
MMKSRLPKLLFTAAALTVSLFAQPKTITVLHTNDMHASFVPHEAVWIKNDSKPLVGGFNELSFAVDSLRKGKNATLFLDAGDVMTGNPITEYDYRGAQGGALFEMMNMLGYEAWCPGNHDFDISQDNLIRLTSLIKFPTLSANLKKSGDRLFGNDKEYVIIEKNGLKIGIIGLITEKLSSLVNESNLTGLSVDPMAATLQRLINKLDPQTDLLIALTHQGVDEDEVLARSVTGLDIIIGGHSHTRIKQPRVVNGILIVQAGSNCENLGVLTVTVDHDTVSEYNCNLLQLWYTSTRPKTVLSRFIDSVQTSIDKDYNEVLATLDGDWKRSESGSAIGNFIADAQREAAHADVAFMNNSGIRKELSRGPITKRALFEVMPFRNTLVTFPLTGAQVKQVIVHSIKNKNNIHPSGIRCGYRRSGNEIIFDTIEINGKPIDESAVYTCAVSDYFAGEAKRYIGIEPSKVTNLQQTVFSAMEKKVREEKNIHPVSDFRISELTEQ